MILTSVVLVIILVSVACNVWQAGEIQRLEKSLKVQSDRVEIFAEMRSQAEQRAEKAERKLEAVFGVLEGDDTINA